MTDLEFCKLCRQSTDLLESHIIPRSFFKLMLEKGESYFFKVSTEPKLHGKKTASQLTERLLCFDCEKQLKKYEDYVIDLFRSGAGAETAGLSDRMLIRGVDYSRLRLFQLSILWRMSVSKQYFFSAVDLGPHEETMRQMLRGEDPGTYSKYPCMMTLLYAIEPELKGAFNMVGTPAGFRINGHRLYRVAFGSCIWTYFVSNHFDIERMGGVEWVIKPDGKMSLPVRNIRNIPFLTEFFNALPRVLKQR